MTPPIRLFPREGQRRQSVRIRGRRRLRGTDAYYFLVAAPWWVVLLLFAGAYLFANAVFAAGYLVAGGVSHVHGFRDAFFFSVQSLATIGYGQMYPQTLGAHCLVTLETLVGLLGMATATGLVFAKFSRPTARVLFSEVAVISPRDGVPTLMFRVANERANHLVEATLHVGVLRTRRTLEGELFRQVEDLRLVRHRSPAFVLTWTVMHPIDADSPLYGATPESLRAQAAEIIVTLSGLDGTLSQTIHARHSYVADELRMGHRFLDVISSDAEGTRWIDYGKFHQTEPLATADGQGAGPLAVVKSG